MRGTLCRILPPRCYYLSARVRYGVAASLVPGGSERPVERPLPSAGMGRSISRSW
jgi:hypothetical protein